MSVLTLVLTEVFFAPTTVVTSVMIVFLPFTSRLLVEVVPILVPALVAVVLTVVFAVPSS